MSSPNNFIQAFCSALHEAEVKFAITSGQACVYFGIQQTTKDSDWIIEPADMARLRNLLLDLETSGAMNPSYRAICGAPLEQEFLGNGWTSHLVISDSDSDDHHLDFFGKPPRVSQMEHHVDDPNIASRHVVAQMKKTDREKDWPFVAAIARQAVSQGDARGILHGRDADWLVDCWKNTAEYRREELVSVRPLLQLIDTNSISLRRALAIEKQIWMTVNRDRYRAFQHAWKEFYRKWRRESGFTWPAEVPFSQQHELLLGATEKYELPVSPLDDGERQKAIANARAAAIEIFATTDEELERIVPPIDVLLP